MTASVVPNPEEIVRFCMLFVGGKSVLGDPILQIMLCDREATTEDDPLGTVAIAAVDARGIDAFLNDLSAATQSPGYGRHVVLNAMTRSDILAFVNSGDTPPGWMRVEEKK